MRKTAPIYRDHITYTKPSLPTEVHLLPRDPYNVMRVI